MLIRGKNCFQFYDPVGNCKSEYDCESVKECYNDKNRFECVCHNNLCRKGGKITQRNTS